MNKHFVTVDTKYAENMANIRHYSGLRFAMLTVFIAITGALLNHITQEGCSPQVTTCHYALAKFLGIWVSCVFSVFEIALNFYLHSFWARVSSANTWVRWSLLAWLVRLAALSIPFGALIVWIFQV